jgi:serine/threonine protein kinase
VIRQGLSSGALLDGKYAIEALLGQGGMGAVYRAVHLGTKRTVAIKVIHPQLSRTPEFVERFRREAEAAGRLRHPNVVDVTDFGFGQTDAGPMAYLVMEYLDGCTLAQVLSEEGRLPRDWVVDILEQVCSAVDTAHHAGIIHRDLKPENIWLEPNRRGGYTIKVLDFGLVKLEQVTSTENGFSQLAPDSAGSQQTDAMAARIHGTPVTFGRVPADEASTLIQPSDREEARTLIQPEPARGPGNPESVGPLKDSHPPTGTSRDSAPKVSTEAMSAAATAEPHGLTRVGTVMGTPMYMSPEQLRGGPVDARTDIYSLGVIAYRMLAGELPFDRDKDPVESRRAVEPRSMREKEHKVPHRLARVVMSALSMDPDERPATAAGFASSLRAASEGSGSLLRDAISLYSERFPSFIKTALLSYIPVIAIVALMNLDESVIPWERLGQEALMILGISLIIAMIVANSLAYSMVAAAVAPIVVQSMVAPLRPVRIKTAFAAVARRWRVFALCTAAVIAMMLGGSILFLVPGLAAAVLYALYAPVVVMEKGGVLATLKRAKGLIKRSWSTALVITLLQLALPVLVWYASVGIKVDLKLEGLSPKEFGLNVSISARSSLYQLLNILVAPLTAIMTSLLYLKMRHAGGESLRDAIEQFDSIEIPRSKWQAQMRSRMASSTLTSGSREIGRRSI